MSAAQTQNDGGEAGWSCLEALGLSQKELVVAEALQMEYDALSRLKQDKGGTDSAQPGTLVATQSGAKTVPKAPTASIERPRPTPGRPIPSPPGGSLLRGLSGSDSSLNHLQPGGSQSPWLTPARATPPRGGYSKEPLYILESPEVRKDGDYSGSSNGDSLPKGFPSLPDDPPPAIPPRNPIPPSSGSETSSLPPRGSTLPRDINVFTPEVDQPKLTLGENLNYDNINDSLSRLNGDWQAPWGRRANGDQSGKHVARSKTLPPQVPPRTYIPVPKSNKNQRRVSADPVRT